MNHRIIARLDIKGPNLVKGVHLEGLRVLGKPEQFARTYYESGADELIYMDVVASLYERNSLLDIVERTSKEIFIPLTVGGGLRSVDDIRSVLRAGADKVSLNTAAIRRPELIREASRAFGSSTIVVSIEAIRHSDGNYEAYVDTGRQSTGIDAYEWALRATELGAGELLVTSIDREGTGRGFDLELTRKIARAVPIPVIAAGGAGKREHVSQVIDEGHADAVSLASLLHYNVIRNLALEKTVDFALHRTGDSGRAPTRADSSEHGWAEPEAGPAPSAQNRRSLEEREFASEGNVEFLRRGSQFLNFENVSLNQIKKFLNENHIPCRETQLTDHLRPQVVEKGPRCEAGEGGRLRRT